MKLLLTGGTGFIGRHLVRACPDDEITVVSRSPERARRLLGNRVEVIPEPVTVDGYDAIVNLAGEPIADRRWSEEQQNRIKQSRWRLTERLAQLCAEASAAPRVFVSGSAVGYYGRQGDNVVDESTAPHPEFTHEVCKEWEARAQAAASNETRVCLLRTGIVLGTDGGALKKMLLPFQMGLGGPLGDGQQFMPWMHIRDEVRAIRFLLENDEASGPFNLSAPHPVTNNEFTRSLARVLHRPAVLRAPGFALKLALGEMAELLLTGQRAVPKALLSRGFTFDYPELKPALENVLGK